MKLADYLFIFLGVGIGLLLQKQEPKAIAIDVTPKAEVADTLTEWQQLQLAIAITESRCDPQATGAAQDAGILQITPIYAREASRLSSERTYSHNEAYDLETSLEMFAVVQGYHNPSHDIDKAITLHNKADWYKRRVLKNIEFIKQYEAARRAVIDYELRKGI